MALYLLWLLSIFGNLASSRLRPRHRQGGDVGCAARGAGPVIESRQVSQAINLFSMAAIPLLLHRGGARGVRLSGGSVPVRQQPPGRAKSWAVTFLPPGALLMFLFGFVVAIGYAGAAVATVWACIIPALLAKKSRELAPDEAGFKGPGGQPMVVAVIVFGVLTAIFHLMAMAGLLPVYTG